MIKGYKQNRDSNFFKLDTQRTKAEKKKHKTKAYYNEQDDIDVDDLCNMSSEEFQELYGEKEED